MATDAPARPEPPPPDVFGIDAEPLPARAFPGRETEYRVVLDPDARRAILDHARSRPDLELCGVLVGDLLRDDDGPYLVITDVIRGQAARQGDTSVTFTHSTWEQIHREMDAKHAERRIVGWYHTHPGFGVFLSEVDLFAHRNFFDAAWQVALVVDPKADQIGLFFWSGGAIVRARRFWVGEEVHWDAERPAVSAAPGKLSRPRAEPVRAPLDANPPARTDDRLDAWLQTGLVALLGAACLVLAYLNMTQQFRGDQLRAEAANLRRQLEGDSSALARSLAFRLRDRLDAGAPASASLRNAFDEVVRLDPAHRAFYARFLPELAPPPNAPASGSSRSSAKAKRPRAAHEKSTTKGGSPLVLEDRHHP